MATRKTDSAGVKLVEKRNDELGFYQYGIEKGGAFFPLASLQITLVEAKVEQAKQAASES